MSLAFCKVALYTDMYESVKVIRGPGGSVYKLHTDMYESVKVIREPGGYVYRYV